MATNVFFSPKVRSEQYLFEDIVIESLKMYGQDVFYLPRRVVTRDLILGEDVEANFDTAYELEAYIENTEGFEGEGNLLSKFGMEIRDEATFIVAKRRWEKAIGYYEAENNRPLEGDLIYLPLSKSFFEISFVEHEQPFYQLSQLPVYKLRCRLFEYNEEDFSTGFEDIDSIEGAAGYKQLITVTNVQGTFEVGKSYYQEVIPGVTVSAEVAEFDGSLMQLVDLRSSDGRYRELVVDQPIQRLLVDGSVEASADVTQVFGLESIVDQTFANDLAARNYTFEQQADSIIDFTESNPFGEPGKVAATAVSVDVISTDSDNVTIDNSLITMDNG